MLHLADLLATLPLPASTHADPPACTDPACTDPGRRLAGHGQRGAELVHELGADLPAGHLHVWGGPTGAGKTAFLLCLLQCAAARGRRVVYATYDLPPESLAMRLLAMTAGVEWRALPDPGGDAATCTLVGAELERAHAARELLSSLPFEILPSRGFSTPSLHDRLVRQPYRAEVLAIDYLQGVIREPGSPLGSVLRDLAALAEQLHLAVVCAVRSGDAVSEEFASEEFASEGFTSEGLAAGQRPEVRPQGVALPDRVGWIGPLGPSGARQAQVLHNRYGPRSAVPLHLDEATGSVGRAETSS